MEPALRILIADDHPIFREGLVKIIAQQESFTLVGQASDGEAALERMRTLHPDVSVLDVEMPRMSGIEVAERVHTEGIPTDIVLLTMHNDASLLNAALDLGVRGYLLKDSVIDEFLQCLTAVARGQYYISAAMSHLLVERKKRMSALLQATPALARLTPAERSILKLLAGNLTSKEIAAKLCVSTRTIENHRLRMGQKLGLSGHNKLLEFALEHKTEL
jgi:DNA-binding NarL/FixJ family response regulator